MNTETTSAAGTDDENNIPAGAGGDFPEEHPHRCWSCKHIGLPEKKYSLNFHGDGATEEVYELACECCWSRDVYPVGEPS